MLRPVGLQSELFTLGLPGSARPLKVREFTQHQLAEDWAMSGAFARSEVGDPNGILLGLDLDCGTARPVMVNVADAPQQDASASLAVIGDLGGGKSVLQKNVQSAVVDRGARAICIDRTPVREWATFARGAAPGRCQVIDAAQAELSIDPLRLFTGPEGRQYALNYLTLQLGIGSMTVQGEVLHHAVEQAAGMPDASMAKVVSVLAQTAAAGTGKRSDAAASVAGMLNLVTSSPLAAMVFDPALPIARLNGSSTADLIVITTAGLTLPPKQAFENPEILHQQPLEALIGRAALYLIAAMARQAAFSDPSRFCAVVTDELYWLTSSAEGTALVHEILHDGRKHNSRPARRVPRREGTRPRPRTVRLQGPGPHDGPRACPPRPQLHRPRRAGPGPAAAGDHQPLPRRRHRTRRRDPPDGPAPEHRPHQGPHPRRETHRRPHHHHPRQEPPHRSRHAAREQGGVGMSSRLWPRRRALAACTATGTVIALLIAAIVFVIAAPGVPSAWWPQTGNAFASSPSAPSDTATTPAQGAAHGQAPAATPSNESEVCDAIVG